MYDCKTCGACCCFKWSWPILKRDRSDATGIPNDMQREDYPLMKTTNNRCIALEGTVGETVCCMVYPNRPKSCANFVVGSELCKEARRKENLWVE
jgi:Fe-S-cluster containining protein